MTKPSNIRNADQLFCVRFTEIAGYKVMLHARDERHAIRLAKRRWYHGSQQSFAAFAGETQDWDAELDRFS